MGLIFQFTQNLISEKQRDREVRFPLCNSTCYQISACIDFCVAISLLIVAFLYLSSNSAVYENQTQSDNDELYESIFANMANPAVLWTPVVWVSAIDVLFVCGESLHVQETSSINISLWESSPVASDLNYRGNVWRNVSVCCRDWQLALFEVRSHVRMFEAGRETRQWHLSCALNIWRGFKQSNISAK